LTRERSVTKGLRSLINIRAEPFSIAVEGLKKMANADC
jgi:hypothetical protein